VQTHTTVLSDAHSVPNMPKSFFFKNLIFSRTKTDQEEIKIVLEGVSEVIVSCDQYVSVTLNSAHRFQWIYALCISLCFNPLNSGQFFLKVPILRTESEISKIS
jgi:hypothetical protein